MHTENKRKEAVGGRGEKGKKKNLYFLSVESHFFFFNKFIYLILAALGLRCCAWLSLVAASGGYSSLRCMGFSLR